MRLTLTPHPDTPSAAVRRIEVDVLRPKFDLLALHFVASGAIDALALPNAAAPQRADELWKHTCFEAFLLSPDGAYLEFNFAPSTQWAAYRFAAYRTGMQNVDAMAPAIETRIAPDRYDLQAQLALPGDGPWRLALSAVIEERGGAKSYWALRHAPGKPDFHHSDSFAYEMGA